MVEAIHTAVPGRARFKVNGLHRSVAMKRFLEKQLRGREEIFSCFANPLTGNLLICFNSGNTHHTIAALLEDIVEDYWDGNGNGTASPSPPVLRPSPARSVSPPPLLSQPLAGEPLSLSPSPLWHEMTADAVLAYYDTPRELGLRVAEAWERLTLYGPNELPEAEPRSALDIFLDQFKSLPVALLGAAAGISLVTGGLLDAVLIAGVVVINGLVAYKTESEADRTIKSLHKLVQTTSLVRRDGKTCEIPAAEVVPGDILVLKPGVAIAADCRLVEAERLSIDESALTGESMPVSKLTAPLSGDRLALADRINMIYKGTLVTGGQGLAVAVATGHHSELGRLQLLLEDSETPETPLERQLGETGDKLVLLCCGICGLVLAVGLLRGYGWLSMLGTSVSLAAAAVPEGLPAVATTTLALGVRDMQRHHVLIRRLEAVETLGAVQTVCLDKTGTITENRMSVVRLFAGMERYDLQNEHNQSPGHNGSFLSRPEIRQLLKVGVLCNETEINGGVAGPSLAGSATETALVRLAQDAGNDVVLWRRQHPLLNIQHRSEDRLYMSTWHHCQQGDGLVAVKGSPLEVLAMCDRHLKDGQMLSLRVKDRVAIEVENDQMAGDALRVLGLAYAEGVFTPEGGNFTHNSSNGLIWLGIVGLADPVRRGVKELIQVFHRAGIETVMITGDQSQTAYAIGKTLDLSHGDPLEILDSTQLTKLDDAALMALAKRVHIFARVTPAHKLQIVQALQRAGRVVAMTGDGINDGPALKAADVGIAMGHSGTDIAREVADVVLEKDNLETLVVAVRDGRTTYNNIKKAVHFFLATNLSEIMVMVVPLAAGLGSPLNPMQLLWINLISDIAPGLTLAMEAPEPDILDRPPRDPRETLFSRPDFFRMARESAVISAGALTAYGYGILRYGLGAQANTLAFNSLTIGQLLHAISCRSETHSFFRNQNLPPNRYFTLALTGSLALQGLAMLVPGIRTILGLTPINLMDALVIGATAVTPLLVNEAAKQQRTSV